MSAINSLLHRENLTRDEIISLLELRKEDEIEEMFSRADEIRRQEVGNDIHVRGILEISNSCACDCLYCGLRKPNRTVSRYRMSIGDITERAEKIAAAGIRTLVLQSGESEAYDSQEISQIIRTIRSRSDMAITLSLGVRDEDTYRVWREHGADRYLLKHESANRSLFEQLKPGCDFDERIGSLKVLKRLGYQIGTGNMVGLPGQSTADIADDILLCRDLGADMCTFGPFIASPRTPLAGEENGSVFLSLKTIAAARIVLRDVHIPANTALATLDASARVRSLDLGANVVMPNFTPARYRKHYEIYPKDRCDQEDAHEIYRDTVELISRTGRPVGQGKGHSPRVPV